MSTIIFGLYALLIIVAIVAIIKLIPEEKKIKLNGFIALLIAVIVFAVVFGGIYYGAAKAEEDFAQAPGRIVSIHKDVITVDTVGNYIVFYGTGYREGDIVYMLLFGPDMETIDAIQLTQLYRPFPLQ